MERQRGREEGNNNISFYIICFCSLYYFIGLDVKTRTWMLGVLLNGLVKKVVFDDV